MKTTKNIEFGKIGILSTLLVAGLSFANFAAAVENPVSVVDIKYKKTLMCAGGNLAIEVFKNSDFKQSVLKVEEIYNGLSVVGEKNSKSKFTFYPGKYEVTDLSQLFEKIQFDQGSAQLTVVKSVKISSEPFPEPPFCGRGVCFNLPKAKIKAEFTLNQKTTSLECHE